MKKKFQDWLRKQVGCPKCDARAGGLTLAIQTKPTTWPTTLSNGQSVTYTYQTRGDA